MTCIYLPKLRASIRSQTVLRSRKIVSRGGKDLRSKVLQTDRFDRRFMTTTDVKLLDAEGGKVLLPGEREGVMKALDAVRQQELSYAKSGLSPFTFFLGIMNVAVTGMMLGRLPEYYWLLQVFKAILFLGLMTKIKRSKNQAYYLFDFCWIMSFVYSAYGLVCIIGALGADVHVFTSSPFIWGALWGLANGPLGWSVMALSNALVLHDVEHTASLYIHISPPLVTWAMRWSATRYNATWPGLFGMPLGEVNHGFVDIFVPAIICYFVHAFFYTIWLLASGRFHSKDLTGHDTVYHSTLRSNTAVARLLRYNPKDPSSLVTAIKYCCMHAMLCTVAICISVVFYYSEVAHTIFCALLCCVCSWNGAQKYVKMMTRYYEKKIELLLADYDAAGKRMSTK